MKLPNEYGSIVKLAGNRRKPFAVRVTEGWTEDGRQKRKYLGYYVTRKDALAALAEYHAHPYDVDAVRTTFDDMWEKWTALTYKDEKVPAPYIAAYKRLPNLHAMPFAEIRRRHIQAEIDACPLGYSTKRMMKTLCNKLFKLAIDCELVTTNYATDVSLPPKEQSRKHHPFTDDELAILWKHTDDFSACVALVLCYSGFRPTELMRVRKEDVHLVDRIMFGGMKTAAGRNRAVPIAKKILPIIERWMQTPGEYLVMDPRDGKPVYSFDRLRGRVWEPSNPLKLLSRQHFPHDGRHTCATRLDDAGVNIKVTQLILGHRSTDITRMVYTHKTYSQLIEAIDKI